MKTVVIATMIVFGVLGSCCQGCKQGLKEAEDGVAGENGTQVILLKSDVTVEIQRDSPSTRSLLLPPKSRSASERTDLVIAYFTKCIEAASPLNMDMVSMYVNFIVRHDVWFQATDHKCKNSRDIATCWKDQASYLLDMSSVYFRPLHGCLKQYWNGRDPYNEIKQYQSRNTEPCKACTQNAKLNFNSPATCTTYFDFAKCMKAEQRSSYYCDYRGDKRKFEFESLETFIIHDRRKCRFTTKYNGQYEMDCDESTPQPPQPSYTNYWNVGPWDMFAMNVEGYNNDHVFDPEPEPDHQYNTYDPWMTFNPSPRPKKCFEEMMFGILSETSYLRDSYRRCQIRQQQRNERYNDLVGNCPGNSYWTNWIDSTNPKRNGFEKETISNYNHQRSFRSRCFPRAIQARTVKGVPFTATNDYVTISPTEGLQCSHFSCDNYKVRFCCKSINRYG